MDPFGRMEQRVERQAVREVRRFTSGCIFSIVFAIISFCIVAAVIGYVVFVAGRAATVASTTGANATGDAAWTGAAPFSCAGAQNLTITGVTAALPAGPAISTAGACTLTLVNCNITAPVVISSAGASHVTISGGSITGTITSIEASGGSTVDVAGAVVTGPVQRSGGAHVNGVP